MLSNGTGGTQPPSRICLREGLSRRSLFLRELLCGVEGGFVGEVFELGGSLCRDFSGKCGASKLRKLSIFENFLNLFSSGKLVIIEILISMFVFRLNIFSGRIKF